MVRVEDVGRGPPLVALGSPWPARHWWLWAPHHFAYFKQQKDAPPLGGDAARTAFGEGQSVSVGPSPIYNANTVFAKKALVAGVVVVVL